MPLNSEAPRREHRRTYLDASVLPVEQALLARASALTVEADDGMWGQVKLLVAAEFRLLAEELHWR